MREAQSVIKRPLLTEKSARLRETGGRHRGELVGLDAAAGVGSEGERRRGQDQGRDNSSPAARDHSTIRASNDRFAKRFSLAN